MKNIAKRLRAFCLGFAIFGGALTAFHIVCWATAAFMVWGPLPFLWGVERFFLAIAFGLSVAFSLSKEAIE